jgi:predicted patatin/cPLA2 family phospholipase
VNPVIDLLRARRGRRPPFADDASIALVVEGGAMRGVVSAGMVSALEALGLTTAFDAVYGSSAGAINAAYFLAGQAALGTTIYSEDINNRHFIDMRRLASGRPIVNLSFLLDDVAVSRKPLDYGRVLASPTPLTVLATDVATAERAILGPFTSAGALRDALRASATMPIIAGDPVTVDGHRYFDASLTEPIPVPTAEAAGHTHLLVLLTRPSETPRKTTWFDRVYVLPRLRRVSPALARKYRDRGEPYTSLLAQIAAGRGPAGRAVVCGLRPAAPAVSKLECDAAQLQSAAARGFAAVMTTFGPL